MTAQEIRELTNSNKKDIEYIYSSIEVMAKGGNNYATFETKLLRNPELYKKELEENGFTVELSEKFFHVKW